MFSAIDPLVIAYAGLVGLLVASFLNVAVYRLPLGETIVRGRSHCPTCGHPLGAADLVPVFSYLLLGRRCRYCRAPISSRYMTVELAGGVFFTLAALALKPYASPAPLLLLILICALFSLLLVDSLIRYDGHERSPAGLGTAVLALAGMTAAYTVIASATGLAMRPTELSETLAAVLPDIGIRLAGLALGQLTLPVLGLIMREPLPPPTVRALPAAGLCLSLPGMLLVLLPVLAMLMIAARLDRSAQSGHSSGAEQSSRADWSERSARFGRAAAWFRRTTPLAGFVAFSAGALVSSGLL